MMQLLDKLCEFCPDADNCSNRGDPAKEHGDSPELAIVQVLTDMHTQLMNFEKDEPVLATRLDALLSENKLRELLVGFLYSMVTEHGPLLGIALKTSPELMHDMVMLSQEFVAVGFREGVAAQQSLSERR